MKYLQQNQILKNFSLSKILQKLSGQILRHGEDKERGHWDDLKDPLHAGGDFLFHALVHEFKCSRTYSSAFHCMQHKCWFKLELSTWAENMSKTPI